MKKVVDTGLGKKNQKKREMCKDDVFPPIYREASHQSVIVNQLYLDAPIAEKKALMQLLTKKLLGYKQQDVKKEIFSEFHFITRENVIEKLVESRMKCVYCRESMLFIYDTIREYRQWTLDRIDNEMGHNGDNVVISCLGCNLARRNTNMEKFLFTKQLRILKV